MRGAKSHAKKPESVFFEKISSEKARCWLNLILRTMVSIVKGERKLMNDSVKAVCCRKTKADKEYCSKKRAE